MTKGDIVEKIHNDLGFKRKESSELLEVVFSLMKEILASGEELKISGFGKFDVKQKKNRKGRNPQTGEDLIIESRKVVTFKVSSMLKDRINEQNP